MFTTDKDVMLRAYWGGRVDSDDTQVRLVWDCVQKLASYGGFLDQEWRPLAKPPLGKTLLSTFDDFNAWIHHERDQAENSFSFVSGPYVLEKDMPPHSHLAVSIGGSRGYDEIAANRVHLRFQVGKKRRETDPLPAQWLLEIGVRLVKDFVDLWNPDAVSLDTLDLLEFKPKVSSADPVCGFFSWFSSAVVDSAKLPPAPLREPYRNGMLLGINPATSDPLAAASRLARTVYSSQILGTIPYIQGQPNPT